MRRPPPRDLRELALRAEALAGHRLDEVAAALGFDLDGDGVRTKGKAGELVERALGADAGARDVPDFAALGVELKTVPVGADGRPRESTFVCAITLDGAARATWDGSRVARKLAHVLWVPIVVDDAAMHNGRAAVHKTLGRPVFWRPTVEQTAILRADFADLMARLAVAPVEQVTAHEGRWLQVRPKAADSRVRTTYLDEDGELVATNPRGFYLRARFVGAILSDLEAIP